MKRTFMSLVAAGFLLSGSPASATTTTYSYTGQAFTDQTCTPGAPWCAGQSARGLLRGSVAFNFDTSQFSGTLNLVDGDTAYFYPPYSYTFVGSDFTFPETQVPNGTFFIVSLLSGSFTLVDGSITSWALSGSTYSMPGCGPACTIYGGDMYSSPGGDSYTYDIGETGIANTVYNNLEGAWSSPAVPEPSIWAMLLIGFAGIGFVAYRKKHYSFMA